MLLSNTTIYNPFIGIEDVIWITEGLFCIPVSALKFTSHVDDPVEIRVSKELVAQLYFNEITDALTKSELVGLIIRQSHILFVLSTFPRKGK